MKPKEKIIKFLALLFITSTYANTEQIANDHIDTLDLPFSDDSKEIYQIHSGEDHWHAEEKPISAHILLSTVLTDGRLNFTHVLSGKIFSNNLKLERNRQRNDARRKVREVYLEFPTFGDRKTDLARSSNLVKHIRSMLSGNRDRKQKYARISIYVREVKPIKTNRMQISSRNARARFSLTRQNRIGNTDQGESETFKVLDLKPTNQFRTSAQRSISAVRNMRQKDIELNRGLNRIWGRQTRLDGGRKQNIVARTNSGYQERSSTDSRDFRGSVIRSLPKERLWDSGRFMPDILRRVSYVQQIATQKPLNYITFNRKVTLDRQKRDVPRNQLDARMRNERKTVRDASDLSRSRQINEKRERNSIFNQQHNTQKKLFRDIGQKVSEESVRLAEREEFVHRNRNHRNINGRRMVNNLELKSAHNRVRDNNADDARVTRSNRFIRNARQVEFLNERERRISNSVSRDLKWKLYEAKEDTNAEQNSLTTIRKASKNRRVEHVQEQMRDTRILKDRNSRDSARNSERQSQKRDRYSVMNRQKKETTRTLESATEEEQARDSSRFRNSRTMRRECATNQQNIHCSRTNVVSRKETRRNMDVVKSLRNSNQFQREQRDVRGSPGIRHTEKTITPQEVREQIEIRITDFGRRLESERKNTIAMNSYTRFQKNYNSPQRKFPEDTRLLPSLNNRLREFRKESTTRGILRDRQRQTDKISNRMLQSEVLQQNNLPRRRSVEGRVEIARIYHLVDSTESQIASISNRRDRYNERHRQRNVLEKRLINGRSTKSKSSVQMDRERESIRKVRENERRYVEINDRQNTIRKEAYGSEYFTRSNFRIRKDDNRNLSVRNVRSEGDERYTSIKIRQPVINENRRERKDGERRESNPLRRTVESNKAKNFRLKAKVASDEYRTQEITRVVRNRSHVQRKGEKQNGRSERGNRLFLLMTSRTRLEDMNFIRNIQTTERSSQDTQERHGRGFRAKNYQRMISEENRMRSIRALNKRFVSRVELIPSRVETFSEENDKAVNSKARFNQRLEGKTISQRTKRSSVLVEKLTQISRSRARVVEDKRERIAVNKWHDRSFMDKQTNRVISEDTSAIQIRQNHLRIINAKSVEVKNSNKLRRNVLTIKKQNGPVEQRNGRGLRGKLSRLANRKLGIFKFYSQLNVENLENARFANINNLRLSTLPKLSRSSQITINSGEKTNLKKNVGRKTSARSIWQNDRNVITSVDLQHDANRISHQTKTSPEEKIRKLDFSRISTRDITKHRASPRELTESRTAQIYHHDLRSAQRDYSRSSLKSDNRLNRRINDNIYFDNVDDYRNRDSFTRFSARKSRNTYDSIRNRLQRSLRLLPMKNRQAFHKAVDASRNFGLKTERMTTRNIYNEESRMVSRQAKNYDSRLLSTNTVPENVMYSALESVSIPGSYIMEKQSPISPQVLDSQADKTSVNGRWKISERTVASFIFDLILGLLILVASARNGTKDKPIKEKLCDIFLLRSNVF